MLGKLLSLLQQRDGVNSSSLVVRAAPGPLVIEQQPDIASDLAAVAFRQDWRGSGLNVSPEVFRVLAGDNNQRVYSLHFRVVFTSGSPPGEWDTGLINSSLRGKLAGLIAAYLRYWHPGWKVSVTCGGKYDGRDF